MELKKSIHDLTVTVTPGTKQLILMLQELEDMIEGIIEVHKTDNPQMSVQEENQIFDDACNAFHSAQRFIQDTIQERVMSDITTLRGYHFEL